MILGELSLDRELKWRTGICGYRNSRREDTEE